MKKNGMLINSQVRIARSIIDLVLKENSRALIVVRKMMQCLEPKRLSYTIRRKKKTKKMNMLSCL
jgi:hypothetical protein